MPQAPASLSSFFYWSQLDQAGKEAVIKEVAAEIGERFDLYLETLLEQGGYRKPPPAVRLQMYTARPPVVWEELRLKFPRLYRKDQLDWRELIEKAEKEGPGQEFAPVLDVRLADEAEAGRYE